MGKSQKASPLAVGVNGKTEICGREISGFSLRKLSAQSAGSFTVTKQGPRRWLGCW